MTDPSVLGVDYRAPDSTLLHTIHTFHKERKKVHPVNGEVPPVKGRPWKLPHYANRGKTSSSGGELASARSCFSTVRTALGKLRITGLLARFDVARNFPQFPRPLLLQPTIWTSERGADLGSGRCQPRPHLPIYRMTQKKVAKKKERRLRLLAAPIFPISVPSQL